MKAINYYIKQIALAGILTISIGSTANAQTNVFDDVIATSPEHTYLEAAILQEGLETVLQDNSGTYTVFAPTDQAFENLATALGTDIAGLLALQDLDDILLYHVLGVTVQSSGINNGDIVQPESMTNTLKLTATANSEVFVNQAQVTAPDIMADNGTVHVLNAVVLPYETVVDVAIDNNFNSLATAVITAELMPALTDPLASYTVFAPTDQAFDDLATALGTDIAGLLALQDLADILTYHVLGSEVASTAINNGDIVEPLSTTNTLKLTTTGNNEVFVNQAQVTGTDIMAYNGTVHILDAVVLPYETVVDVAIDNNFNSLATAVITAELMPALTNPLADYTVFAPTDQAFDDLAMALSTDINGLLALPNLADILLYHVVGSSFLSMDLSSGAVMTLEGSEVMVDVSTAVMINDANVTLADLESDNGVVHVVDKVLNPETASISEENSLNIKVYPNPSTDVIYVEGQSIKTLEVFDMEGSMVASSESSEINIAHLNSGTYLVKISTENGVTSRSIQLNAE